MPSLTQDLLDSDTEGFKIATQSKFLELAGKGKLSKEILQKWLGQDRLYAQAYVRFASLLLANVKLPSSINPKHINER
jgi:thiaminase